MPEVDRCDATSKSPPSKLRADATLLHATEVLIATLSDPWEILSRKQGANDCSRAARSYGAAIGDACGLSARAYHPGTAVADHRDIEEAVTRVLDAYR